MLHFSVALFISYAVLVRCCSLYCDFFQKEKKLFVFVVLMCIKQTFFSSFLSFAGLCCADFVTVPLAQPFSNFFLKLS